MNKSLIDIRFAFTTASGRETSFKTGQNLYKKSLGHPKIQLPVEVAHSLITPSISPQANVEMALLRRTIFVF